MTSCVTKHRVLSTTKGRKMLMKAVLNGPFGQVELGPTPLTIGRTPGNQLVLAEPKVSSLHAEIRPQGQDYAIYAIVDLGSTNGTFVNGQRLTSNVPSLLHAGDIVGIGDTRFTYDVPGMSEIDPTVYAGSKQGNDSSYAPTATAPLTPYTGYGADIQQPGAYQVPPPPPAYVGSQPYGYPQGPSYPGAPVAAPTHRPNRRGLWIILGALGGLVVIGLVLFGVIAYVTRSTPTKSLNAFCNALKSSDYQSAYNQLSSGLQSKFGAEAQFAAGYASNEGMGKITDCTVTSVDDGAGTGTINYTLGQGSKLIVDYKLADENGGSKITSQQPRSTPTLTLNTFCTDLKAGDYQGAYNQLSSAAQSQETESQFASNFATNKVSNCTVNNVNDTAGTGTISYTYSNGVSLVADYTLVSENGTWKIKTEQPRSTPILTLSTYCTDLKAGDYQGAYNELSSAAQSQETEAQFASNFGTTKITGCMVSNVNDTAGTGTISYTFANGVSVVADYTLVNENGTWKINTEKVR